MYSAWYNLQNSVKNIVQNSLQYSIQYIVQYPVWKLDGVGPVDNRPSTKKLHYFVRDMWHVRCDTCHVTRDTFGGGVNILSKFQLPGSYLWHYEDLEEKDDWIN